MTFAVDVDDDDVIRDTAPVVGKFVGQPLSNLLRWLGRYGSVNVVELPPVADEILPC